ncbi:flagellar hook-associated protein FlgK [bacterium]|nr:flagellar hook-associated protein FlgK [bacterium]MBU1638470.1 flagellar hook-associated protein FlgK [bacterium]
MSTLSSILNTGRRAIQVQELAMQVIGHNTANVNTEGYSRQRLDFRTSPPGGLGMYNTGSGVDVDRLARVRDSLLDVQIRESRSQIGYWQQRNESLQNVESTLNGLGDVNIDTRLQQFWSAWSDLANDPESESSRLALLQRSQSLTTSIRRAYSDLTDQLTNANDQIAVEVSKVNQLTAQIAALNIAVNQAELNGNEASDLRDQRDLILEELSGIIDVSSQEQEGGAINVYSGGQILVQVGSNVNLHVSSIAGTSSELPTIKHGITGTEMQISQGSLRALLDLRDADIRPALEDLDTLATTLSSRINEIHRTGYGLDNTSGINFFASDVSGAADLRINDVIIDDVARIASASLPDAAGDNSTALAIAAVQHEKLLNDGRATLDEFNRNISLRAGSNLSYALAQLEIEDAAQENLLNRRASISGVSIDEEMTRMIQVQKAYDAAAKIVKTVDEMINTLLSMKA